MLNPDQQDDLTAHHNAFANEERLQDSAINERLQLWANMQWGDVSSVFFPGEGCIDDLRTWRKENIVKFFFLLMS